MPDKLNTREKILTSAIELFAKKGFSQATIDDITQAAGVSHGLFYKYFKNKRQLLMEQVLDLYSKLYKSTQEPWKNGDIYSNLQNSVRGWFNLHKKHWKLMRVWKEVAYNDKEFQVLWNHLADKITFRIQQNIDISIKKAICRNVNAEIAARAISGMIEHYGDRILFEQDTHDLEEIIQTLTDLWYHSLFIVLPETIQHDFEMAKSKVESRRSRSHSVHS